MPIRELFRNRQRTKHFRTAYPTALFFLTQLAGAMLARKNKPVKAAELGLTLRHSID